MSKIATDDFIFLDKEGNKTDAANAIKFIFKNSRNLRPIGIKFFNGFDNDGKRMNHYFTKAQRDKMFEHSVVTDVQRS